MPTNSPRPNMQEAWDEYRALKEEMWATLEVLSEWRATLALYGRRAPHVTLRDNGLPPYGGDATFEELMHAIDVTRENLDAARAGCREAESMVPGRGGAFL